MFYLPIILREDNFPEINFKKLAINRNKKIYLFLNVINGVFVRLAKKLQKVEKRAIESFSSVLKSDGLKVSLQADYKTN